MEANSYEEVAKKYNVSLERIVKKYNLKVEDKQPSQAIINPDLLYLNQQNDRIYMIQPLDAKLGKENVN